MPFEIIPGVLAHSVEEYVGRLQQLESIHAEWMHVDIMDGQFVPNISVMPHEIMSMATPIKTEVHLMTFRPERYFSDLTVAGVQRVLIHREAFETFDECATVITQACDYFPEVGIVLKATTEVEPLAQLSIQTVQCMSVEPGAAGRPFDDAVYATMEHVAGQGLPLIIAADGAVGDDTLIPLSKSGATRFVISSRLFASRDIPANIEHFINVLKEGNGIS